MFGNYVFHVHTKRCGHASDESDEEYIKKAIALGASTIVFTDHAPFPENPFNSRMAFSELNSYIYSLENLKKAYRGQISVHIGLEIEYLPSFISYYEALREDNRIELLVLGQHHYEISSKMYSFMLHDKTNEYVGLAQAMLEGIKTGLFDVVAHPDRIFRREKIWTPDMNQLSLDIISAALSKNMYLEKNYSSMQKTRHYRQDFWKLIPENTKIVYGCDAHTTNDVVLASHIYHNVQNNVIHKLKR